MLISQVVLAASEDPDLGLRLEGGQEDRSSREVVYQSVTFPDTLFFVSLFFFRTAFTPNPTAANIYPQICIYLLSVVSAPLWP